jgi:hypothetical protein
MCALMAVAELIRLRYPAKCAICGGELARGAHAHWDKTAKTATCETCLADTDNPELMAAPLSEIDRGQAGASAAREYRRLHDARETRVRAQHKHLGGLLLAVTSEPQSTAAWDTGYQGESGNGAMLDRLREEGIAVLHDRGIPGSRANIDHIVVSQAAVFVVDSKRYKGRVERRDVGGFFRTDLRLYVGGRDRTKLVAGMTPQLDAVRKVLAERDEWHEVPVTPVLLFGDPDNWSLLDLRPLRFGDVVVLWRRALLKMIRADGVSRSIDVPELERALAIALPRA